MRLDDLRRKVKSKVADVGEFLEILDCLYALGKVELIEREKYCTMLVEVMCDEFKDHGKPRGRIPLHFGLNTVIGSESGANSIGKSTFLMIIDFIFDGDDYVEKLTDLYSGIEAQPKIAAEAKDKYNVFKKAQRYQYIPFVTRQSEYKKNEERIDELPLLPRRRFGTYRSDRRIP